MIRTYSELCKLNTFKERYDYLRLYGRVGKETFGFDRYLNQIIYKLPEWKSVRDKVIVRDCGCDLGMEGYELLGNVANKLGAGTSGMTTTDAILGSSFL